MRSLTYWVVRHVPDPVRGEFSNVAVVAGSHSGGWEIVVDRKWAAKNAHPDFLEWLDWFATEIRTSAALISDRQDVYAWVEGIRERQANSVQLSEPKPIYATSARAALDILYPRLVGRAVEPRRMRRGRRFLQAAIRGAYLGTGFIEGRDFVSRPEIRLSGMRADFDFLQLNEQHKILRSAWSFDVKSVDALAQSIRAWNYSVTRLRSDGGVALQGSKSFNVSSDSIITAVVEPPAEEDGARHRAFSEALDAWERERVEVLSLDQLEERLNHSGGLLTP